MKTVLLTGTSTGLGAELAIRLAKKGYRVWATMRNLDKKDKLADRAITNGVELVFYRLDVEDPRSIETCVKAMIEQEGRIDIVINNAGAGFVRSTEQASEAEINWVMNVNFMGVVRVTKAVIPHMREQRSGHIINISSVGGLVGQPFNEVYCAAKFAVEGYTEAMASYLEEAFGLKFSLIEPGGITSEFGATVFAQLDATGGIREDEYLPVLQRYITKAQQRSKSKDKIFQSCEEVAEVVIACIESQDPPIRVRSSQWAENFCRFKTEADPNGKKQQRMVKEVML